MKKISFLILITILSILMLSLNAFSKVDVVTTFTTLKSITEDIGGDKVSVTSLARWNEDPHFVEARPSFILKLRSADLLVINGADLESWSKSLIENSRNNKIMPGGTGYIDASSGVYLLEKPYGRVDRSQGDVHPFGNPHYWLDPQNAKIIAQNIYNGLVRVDSSNRSYYLNRLQYFKRRCDAITNIVRRMFTGISNKKIIAYHKTWIYFTRRFGISEMGYIEPKPGVSPSVTHLYRIMNIIRSEKIKIILQAHYYAAGSALKVSQNTKTRFLRLQTNVGGNISNYFLLIYYLGQQISQGLK